jgi:hypothetical protein
MVVVVVSSQNILSSRLERSAAIVVEDVAFSADWAGIKAAVLDLLTISNDRDSGTQKVPPLRSPRFAPVGMTEFFLADSFSLRQVSPATEGCSKRNVTSTTSISHEHRPKANDQ